MDQIAEHSAGGIPWNLLRCCLCDAACCSSNEFVLHYARHFAPGKCPHCRQQLVEIEDVVFHLQLGANCARAQRQMDKFTDFRREEHNEVAKKTELASECYEIRIPQRLKVNRKQRSSGRNRIRKEVTWNELSIPALSAPVVDTRTHDRPAALLPTECVEIKMEEDTERLTTANILDGHDDPAVPPKKAKYSYTPRPKPRATPQRRDPRTYECYICKRQLNHLPNLRRHIRNHNRSLTCEQCGVTCANWTNMVHHKKTHTDTKQYMCSYCGRGFHHRFNMMEHMFIHTRVKSYKCPSCDKMFGRRSGLDAHQLIHTGEKPNKCTIAGCDRAYMYSIDLKRHLFGAHGIYTKKHECKVCAKIFPENKLLVAHMKVH